MITESEIERFNCKEETSPVVKGFTYRPMGKSKRKLE